LGGHFGHFGIEACHRILKLFVSDGSTKLGCTCPRVLWQPIVEFRSLQSLQLGLHLLNTKLNLKLATCNGLRDLAPKSTHAVLEKDRILTFFLGIKRNNVLRQRDLKKLLDESADPTDQLIVPALGHLLALGPDPMQRCPNLLCD